MKEKCCNMKDFKKNIRYLLIFLLLASYFFFVYFIYFIIPGFFSSPNPPIVYYHNKVDNLYYNPDKISYPLINNSRGTLNLNIDKEDKDSLKFLDDFSNNQYIFPLYEERKRDYLQEGTTLKNFFFEIIDKPTDNYTLNKYLSDETKLIITYDQEEGRFEFSVPEVVIAIAEKKFVLDRVLIAKTDKINEGEILNLTVPRFGNNSQIIIDPKTYKVEKFISWGDLKSSKIYFYEYSSRNQLEKEELNYFLDQSPCFPGEETRKRANHQFIENSFLFETKKDKNCHVLEKEYNFKNNTLYKIEYDYNKKIKDKIVFSFFLEKKFPSQEDKYIKLTSENKIAKNINEWNNDFFYYDNYFENAFKFTFLMQTPKIDSRTEALAIRNLSLSEYNFVRTSGLFLESGINNKEVVEYSKTITFPEINKGSNEIYYINESEDQGHVNFQETDEINDYNVCSQPLSLWGDSKPEIVTLDSENQNKGLKIPFSPNVICAGAHLKGDYEENYDYKLSLRVKPVKVSEVNIFLEGKYGIPINGMIDLSSAKDNEWQTIEIPVENIGSFNDSLLVKILVTTGERDGYVLIDDVKTEKTVTREEATSYFLNSQLNDLKNSPELTTSQEKIKNESDKTIWNNQITSSSPHLIVEIPESTYKYWDLSKEIKDNSSDFFSVTNSRLFYLNLEKKCNELSSCQKNNSDYSLNLKYEYAFSKFNTNENKFLLAIAPLLIGIVTMLGLKLIAPIKMKLEKIKKYLADFFIKNKGFIQKVYSYIYHKYYNLGLKQRLILLTFWTVAATTLVLFDRQNLLRPTAVASFIFLTALFNLNEKWLIILAAIFFSLIPFVELLLNPIWASRFGTYGLYLIILVLFLKLWKYTLNNYAKDKKSSSKKL